MLEIFLIILASCLFGVNLYLTKRASRNALINAVREQALALFLYAEKQGLPSADRMELVVNQILDDVDQAKLAVVVGEQDVRTWLQNLYDDVKRQLG